MTTNNRIKLATAAAAYIRDMHEVPAGHVYAALMPFGCHIDDFQVILGVLERAKLIKQRNFLITWTGPEAVRH